MKSSTKVQAEGLFHGQRGTVKKIAGKPGIMGQMASFICGLDREITNHLK